MPYGLLTRPPHPPCRRARTNHGYFRSQKLGLVRVLALGKRSMIQTAIPTQTNRRDRKIREEMTGSGLIPMGLGFLMIIYGLAAPG